MKIVNKLTEEQVNRIPTHVKKWIDAGLSTDPANRERAVEGIAIAYAAAGRTPPRIIIWLMSPMAGAIGAEFLRLWAQVGAQVRAQVGAQVWDQVRAQVWAQVRDQASKCGYGQHDAGWLSFYEYFREYCSLECCEKMDGLVRISQNAGWWWPFDNAVILTERHEALHRDSQGRLHCDDGPALRYRDGFAIWSVHGVRVPQYVVENPSKISVQDIETESNAEIRRVKIDRFGQAKYILESGAKEIHHDDFGTLYRKDIPNDEPLIMVKLINSTAEPDGSFKDYWLRVPPTMTRAREAVAWTFYKQEMCYAPCIET